MLKCINPTTFFFLDKVDHQEYKATGSILRPCSSLIWIYRRVSIQKIHSCCTRARSTSLSLCLWHLLHFHQLCLSISSCSRTEHSSLACDIWAGNREHPSSLLPLCQPRARQLLRSKEDPLMPTITQYVAFLSSYINFMLQAIHHFAE